jgi:hypothetical protein
MEPESLLPRLQVPAIRSYPENIYIYLIGILFYKFCK